MLIKRVREIFDSVLNKEEVAGYVSDERFSALCDVVQAEILTEIKIGKGGDRKGNHFFTFYGSGNSTAAIDELSRFTVSKSVIRDSGGLINRPEDYLSFEAASSEYKMGNLKVNVPVALKDSDEFQVDAVSQIVGPTKKRPFMRLVDGGFELIPLSLHGIRLTYLRKPMTPVYKVTEDPLLPGEPVFDESESVDFEISEMMLPEIVYRLCNKMGINLRESEVFQMSKAEQQ